MTDPNDAVPPPTDDDAPAPINMVAPTGFLIEPFLFKTLGGACRLLRHPTKREFLLGTGEMELNELTQRVEIGRVPVTDATMLKFREEVERRVRSTDGAGKQKQVPFPQDATKHAFALIASERPYHPVRDYLRSVKGVNGTIDHVAAEILGLPPGLPRTLIRRWAISAVARVMVPGCKVDTVLILVGEEGLRKSTFFSTLAGEWFGDSYMDIEDKDGYMLLHQSWVHEWAELTAMTGAKNFESVMAFLTSRKDCFRVPWGMSIEDHKRSGVIVGTTNRRDFLTAGRKHRRFWPVEILRLIDTVQLGLLRDAFWGEAVSLYMAKEPWHLDDGEGVDLGLMHETVEMADAWEPLVASHINAPVRENCALLLSDIMRVALGIEKSKLNQAEQRRVGQILSGLGWRQERRRWTEGGEKHVRWMRSEYDPEGRALFDDREPGTGG
jgi:predicted P-loop ATPase